MATVHSDDTLDSLVESDKLHADQSLGASSNHNEWSYHEPTGPETWANKYPPANGQHQSPINIIPSEAAYDQRLIDNPLQISLDRDCCILIKNTGHTFEVDSHKYNFSEILDGPLNNTYRFLQMHMHWGNELSEGSEHLVNGQSHAAEIHLVCWNFEVYNTPEEAAKSSRHDGLAVLGVFVKIGQFNKEFDKINKFIKFIRLKDNLVLCDHIDINNFLPPNREYWTYEGSLTTPPCYESVRWIVFRDPIEIATEQLQSIRKMHEDTDISSDSVLKYNRRPAFPLGNRKLFKNFV